MEKPPPNSPELKVLGLFLLTPNRLLAPHSNFPRRPDLEPSQISKRQIPGAQPGGNLTSGPSRQARMTTAPGMKNNVDISVLYQFCS